MIAGLIGTVHRRESDSVLVRVGGVIYRVFTTNRVLSQLSESTEEVELHIHHIVREDAQTLYGFLTQADLQWFDILIGVNGVGPRLALAVLSRFSADELVSVVADEQVDVLTTVSGVGKRTASRILLDLRGKLPENLETPISLGGRMNQDAVDALQALGYSVAEARAALQAVKLDDSATVEDQIVAALKSLS